MVGMPEPYWTALPSVKPLDSAMTTVSTIVRGVLTTDKSGGDNAPVYRPSTTKPKGAWSRHLDEQRRLRDLSQTQAFELVYERIGWSRKSRTAYVAIDKGERQPKPDEATVLAAEFGWPPDQDEPAPAQGESALIAALGAQTTAINRLIERLDLLASSAIRDGVLDALREAGLDPDAGASPSSPPDGPSL